MAISFPQFKYTAGGTGTVSASFTSGIAAGSVIVVGIGWDPAATTATVANDKGDALTDWSIGVIDASSLGFPVKMKLCAFLTATSGAQTVTVTFSGGTPTYSSLEIYEIAGLTGAVFDKVLANHGTAASATSGSTGTLSASAEAAFVMGFSNSEFTVAGSGWTADQVNSTGDGTVSESKVLSSTAAVTATGTQDGTFYYMLLATLMSGTGSTTLTAAEGSFTETGEAAPLGVKTVSADGTFTETGEAAPLGVKTVSADGTFTETGEAAPLTFSPTMTAAQGSFAETGEAVIFAEVLTSADGTFALTGEAATLSATSGGALTAAQGSFAETGEAVIFAEVLTSADGTFTETGEAAGMVQGTVLTAADGAFTETGEAVAFGIVLTSAGGSFALTGEPAALTGSGVNTTLAAARGLFVLTGEAVTFVRTGTTWVLEPGPTTLWVLQANLAHLLLETGAFLLLESGARILTEGEQQEPWAPASQPATTWTKLT